MNLKASLFFCKHNYKIVSTRSFVGSLPCSIWHNGSTRKLFTRKSTRGRQQFFQRKLFPNVTFCRGKQRVRAVCIKSQRNLQVLGRNIKAKHSPSPKQCISVQRLLKLQNTNGMKLTTDTLFQKCYMLSPACLKWSAREKYLSSDTKGQGWHK